MSIFGKTFDLEHLIEKAMEHVDMEQITADVMADLKITDLNIFFVVSKPDGADDYEFIGMTYAIESAREIFGNTITGINAEILKLDIAKLVPLAKQMGVVASVS